MATYTISTLQQLQDINDGHLADDCVLANDIDATATRLWNQGGAGHIDEYYGFNPIGLPASSFTGTFDGGGYKITNLYINRTSSNGAASGDVIGLFSDIVRSSTGGFVKDLTIENAEIVGGDFTAILAGTVSTTSGYLTVSNVNVSGTITSTERRTGGLVAGSTNGTYNYCSSSVTITNTTAQTSETWVGGLIGNSSGDTCLECLSTATITLDYSGSNTLNCGGLLGESTGCNIDNCNVTCEINCDTSQTIQLGGFIGTINAGTCDASTVKGTVSQLSTAGITYIGGFSGRIGGAGTNQKCSADVDIENYSTNTFANDVGGFVGELTASTVTNCYAKGSVNVNSGIGWASESYGGFVGLHSSTGTISYCYSIGAVYATGTPTNGGGFCGQRAGTPTQTQLYYDNQTSGWTTDGGLATGATTTQLKTQSYYAAGWNFTDVWYISTFTRTPGLATTVWLSEVGDYDNFEEDVKDADSFSLGIPTQNIILWMESLEALLCGTAGDEWTIGSNKLQTPISPTNFAVKEQSTYGSANIQAQKINEVVLFVDFVQRKIREMTYDIQTEKYASPDLTSLAEHITETGVVNIAHQRNPDSILWCVLTDGSLISMVYDRQQDVVAWSIHPIDGVVQSVCVTPGTNEDDVWISVKRTINSVDKLYVEKMATRIQGDIEDSFFVDSGLVVAGTSKTISTLSHLEGETVVALVDGVYDSTFTVESGTITLNLTPTAQTIVGLPYTALLKPMRIVQNSPFGTSLAAVTRINEIKIVFLNTKGAQYGSTTSNLFNINFSDEKFEDAGYVTGLYSGDIKLEMSGGFSIENPIFVSSSQPYPMTVKAMIVNFEQTGR